MTNEEKKYLIDKAHEAMQIVWWLANHPAPTDSESERLKKMTNFLEDLRDAFQDIETEN